MATPADPSLMERFRALFTELAISPDDLDRFVGEFRARVLRAQAGRLHPVNNVKGPLNRPTNIDLFEIRWRFEYGENLEIRVRLYHAEPKKLGSVVIGLHIHVKDVSPGIDVDALQDIEISTAASRYALGKPTNWGRKYP
jgi:hypothetical protein